MSNYWLLKAQELEERLAKFNPHHVPAGSSDGGQFTSADKGPGKGAGSGKGESAPTGYDPKKVVRTGDINEALRLIAEGKDVELETPEQVHTLIDKLHAEVQKMAEKGDKAPNYNLCKVTVAGTSLFCAESKGIARIDMPQLGGTPIPGSRADKLPKVRGGEVDGTDDFIKHMNGLDVAVKRKTVSASQLKATQSELVGAKVAGMMNNTDFDPANAPIFVSRDGYVIDGHHRWATQIGRDTSDNILGDLKMDVFEVDMPISAVLREANTWAEDFGIKAAAATAESGFVGKHVPCLGC
jgi:hypothetical protein